MKWIFASVILHLRRSALSLLFALTYGTLFSQERVIPDAVQDINKTTVYARSQTDGIGTEVVVGLWGKSRTANERASTVLALYSLDSIHAAITAYSDTTHGDTYQDSVQKVITAKYDLNWGAIQIDFATILDKCKEDTICAQWIDSLQVKAAEAGKEFERSIILTGPIKQNEDVFKRLLTSELTELVPASGEEEKTKRTNDIAQFVDAYFWKTVAYIVADPTPVATVVCIKREVPIRSRLSHHDAWVKSQVANSSWLPAGLIVLPAEMEVNPGDSISILWGQIRSLCRATQKTNPRPVHKGTVEPLAPGKGVDTTQAVQEHTKSATTPDKDHTHDAVQEDTTSEITALQTRIKDLRKRNAGYQIGYRERTVTFYRTTERNVTINALVPVDEVDRLLFKAPARFLNADEDEFANAMQGGKPATFEVARVQMKIESGSITGIEVSGKVKSHGIEVLFSNCDVPIPFSRQRDLFMGNLDYFPLYGAMARKQDPKVIGPSADYVMSLSDLIGNLPEMQLNTDNIAPGDTVATWLFNSADEVPQDRLCVSLHKEETKELFQFRIYTDPIGLAKGKPNGLAQTEISRRVGLVAASNYRFNGVRYVEPTFRIQLLNAEERSLALSPKTTTDPMKVDALGQLNKATWDLDLKLNAMAFSERHSQSEFEFNLICGFHSTRITDSVATSISDTSYTYSAGLDTLGNAVLDSTMATGSTPGWLLQDAGSLNSFTYGAELRWKVRPDGRYGFDLFTGVAHYVLLAPTDTYTTDLERHGSFPTLLFAGLEGWFKPSKADQWFFRARYTGDVEAFQNHYMQLQIGYNRRLNFKVR